MGYKQLLDEATHLVLSYHYVNLGHKIFTPLACHAANLPDAEDAAASAGRKPVS